MDAENAKALLEQLRDVQLPEPVSWWPPAPGWWLLAILVLVSLFAIIRFWLHRRQRNRYRHDAIASLKQSQQRWEKNQQVSAYLRDASQVLRRVAIHVKGRERVSALTADAWLSLLDSMAKSPFSARSRDALATALYEPAPNVDVPLLHSELLSWLRSHHHDFNAKDKTGQRTTGDADD